MPNAVDAVYGTRDRENFIQFVAIHDFTYSLGLLAVHDITTMGNTYRNAIRNRYKAALHLATFIIKYRPINSFLWFHNFQSDSLIFDGIFNERF